MKKKFKPNLKNAVKEGHGNFKRCDAVKDVPKEEVPDDSAIIGNTWAMDKKPTKRDVYDKGAVDLTNDWSE